MPKENPGNANVTNEDQLATLNSRPLSYVAVDDLEEPLTPSYLLHWRRISSLRVCVEEEEPEWLDGKALNRRAAHLKMLMDHFWKR